MTKTTQAKTDKTNNNKLLKRMLTLVQPYKKQFWLSIFIGLILSIIGPLKPKLVMLTIEDNIQNNVGLGIPTMVGLYFSLLFIEASLQYCYKFLSKVVSVGVIKDLRVKVFNHITNLQLRFFNQNPIGKLTTRTINDIEALNRTFSDGLINVIQDILKIIFIILFMFLENWKLAFLTLIPFPLIMIATYIFKEKVKEAFQRVRSTVQDLNTFMQEHISGMKVVQFFSIEKQTLNEFDQINRKNQKANTDTVTYYAIYFPVIEILTALALALLLWHGGKKIAVEQFHVDEIIGFYMWSVMLFRPLRMLADRFNILQMGMVASNRVFELIDTNESLQNEGILFPEKLDGAIEFKQVYFGYNDDHYVLRDISFRLKKGQMLALVGSTGSGKSTTINLINRFFEPQKGEILIDNQPIKDYNIQALRDKIATVQQDVFLFSGSIYDNIILQNPKITKDDVIEAAKEVGVHDFIMTLPQNYNYKVMERGGTLSTGQRQLISFIRAMVSNPDILILDEATASIDTETELLLQKATEKIMKNRTSIVIAHRLSTIQKADQIMVIQQGQIKEIGTHDELINKGEEYFKLYNMQFKKQ